MGSVEEYRTEAGRRYRVRYRDPERRSREKAGFRTKRDAEEYLAGVTVSTARGEYIDPNAARATISDLGTQWLKNQSHLKPSAWRPLEITWRLHVEPQWGRRRVGDIRFSEVQTWVTTLGEQRSPTTVLRAYGILAGILDVAVRDLRIPTNHARGVNLPRKNPKRRAYLNHHQVELLASHAGDHGTLVRLLAYTGLRWGEVTALRVRHLEMLRGRLRVEENAVNVGRDLVVGTPKSHQTRSVPFPRFLADELAERCTDKTRDQLVFGNGTTHQRPPDSRRGWFISAVKKSQAVDPDFPAVTIHDLRHTAASLSISSGANVKAVQRMLGHASAAMTLDVYGDLFEDDLDTVSERLHEARSRTVVGGLWGISAKSTRKAPESQ